jgi:hypothetical protein
VAAEPVAPADLAELRGRLEVAARAAVAEAGLPGDAGALRLPKHRIAALLDCERNVLASLAQGPVDDLGDDPRALALGRLVDVLAGYRVLKGPDAPRGLAMGTELIRAAAGDRPDAVLEWLDGRSTAERLDLAAELDGRLEHLLAGWPAFDPAWWPRTQEAVALTLADGQVVVSGRLDIALGGPPTAWPMAVVEVKSGRFSGTARDEQLLYALLVTLRDGRAPGVVVTCAALAESPVAYPVTTAHLRPAVGRLEAALAAAGRIAGGAHPPAERASWRCRPCPDQRSCPSYDGR